MANNKEGYDRAKNDGEPALRLALLHPDCDFPLGPVVDVNAGTQMGDKKLHIDVVVHYVKLDGRRGLVNIDLKDPDRIDTGNVTLDVDEVEFFRTYDEEAPRYILAFRLNDGISRRYDMFRMFKVPEVLSYIDEKKPKMLGGNGKRYYLISLSDLTESRPHFEVGTAER